MAFANNEHVAHRRAQDAFSGVLGNVKADQLGDPTPCAGWTVRDLITHVVGGNQRTAGVPQDVPADVSGIVDAQRASADAAQAVFDEPDGLTRIYDVPFGSVPGSIVIGLRTADVLTHAWDLARATDQPTDLDPELAVDMLEWSKQMIRPEFRGEGRPFDAEQASPADATKADQLAAFLGRRVQ